MKAFVASGRFVAGEIRFSSSPPSCRAHKIRSATPYSRWSWWRHYLTSSFCRQHSVQESRRGRRKKTRTNRAFTPGISWDKLFRVYHLYNGGQKSNITFIPLKYRRIFTEGYSFYLNFLRFILNQNFIYTFLTKCRRDTFDVFLMHSYYHAKSLRR